MWSRENKNGTNLAPQQATCVRHWISEINLRLSHIFVCSKSDFKTMKSELYVEMNEFGKSNNFNVIHVFKSHKKNPEVPFNHSWRQKIRFNESCALFG